MKLPEDSECSHQIVEDKDKSFHSAQSSNSLVEESVPLIDKENSSIDEGSKNQIDYDKDEETDLLRKLYESQEKEKE